MASLSKSKNGTCSIQFLVHGKRKTIYAGKMEPREAERLRDKVEELARIKNRNGRVEESEDILKWLSKSIGTKLHDKLVNVGLVEAIKNTQLKPFIDAYIASRTDIKASTGENLVSSEKVIVKHFGGGTDLRGINSAHASEFKAAMMARYANATVGRHLRRGKQFFGHAVRAGIIARNPFDGLKFPNQANRSRLFFVGRAICQKVLDACPNLQWRLIFSMARFGGLRIPSELVGLKWEDVLWDQKKIRVPSPKTEHIPGKDHRWVPLFPEIMEPLRQAFDLAKEGDQFIFPRTITGAINLRKGLNSIIKKAGLSPWPKLFQNLRASRETELCQDHPLHVAAAWLGNTPTVAIAHYLSVIDSDWEKATTPDLKSDVKFDATGAKTGLFSMDSGCAMTSHNVSNLVENALDSSVLSGITEELLKDLASRQGLEP